MISPRRWQWGLAIIAGVVALATSAGSPRAELAFRKKPAAQAPAPAPTGGDLGTDAAGAAAAPKGPVKLQAQDPDAPRDPAEVKPATLDPALVKPLPPPPPQGPPLYKQWKFWAVTGAIVVGAVAVVWGGSALLHAANGGDVKSCPMNNAGCFGEGR
jgi:hypothetical protein